MAATDGLTLSNHATRSVTLDAVDEGGWDVVVLQDQDIRPTSSGDLDAFYTAIAALHDRIKLSSPAARVVLYETWARSPAATIYPAQFADPAAMQAEVREAYGAAAFTEVADRAETNVSPDVEVSPVGDAWESHLAQSHAQALHQGNNRDATSIGQYLSGLVLYGTIYDRTTLGLPRLDRRAGMLARSDADAILGDRPSGGPTMELPVLGLEPGQVVRFDFGTSAVDGWNVVREIDTGFVEDALDDAGDATPVDLLVSVPFIGTNSSGDPDNDLNWPAGVTTDSLYCGSHETHELGLESPAQVVIGDLQPGQEYDLRLFASRLGADGNNGRLTRYSVSGAGFVDVDATNNADQTAEFTASADASGTITVDIAVSPDGASRFCYLGALELTAK